MSANSLPTIAILGGTGKEDGASPCQIPALENGRECVHGYSHVVRFDHGVGDSGAKTAGPKTR